MIQTWELNLEKTQWWYCLFLPHMLLCEGFRQFNALKHSFRFVVIRHDHTKVLQGNWFISWLLSSYVSFVKESPGLFQMKRRGSESHLHRTTPTSPSVVPVPSSFLWGFKHRPLSGRLTLRSYFLTNKVKGERLLLISALTGASLWPLSVEALHLSHTDLSSLVPFFRSSDIETSLRSAVVIALALVREESTLNLHRYKTLNVLIAGSFPHLDLSDTFLLIFLFLWKVGAQIHHHCLQFLLLSHP